MQPMGGTRKASQLRLPGLVPLALVACLACLPAGAASANDSVAHLATGGLVLSRTDKIELKAEELFVSRQEIRVRYRFVNLTDADVTTLVAFPLPDVRAPSDMDNFVIPVPESASNFLAFETVVDGRKVAMEVEQRAIAVGVDRTEWLKDLSLPVAPHDPALPALLAALSDDTRRELREAGMIDDSGLTSSLPVSVAVRPLWTARTTYFWKQTFPAGRELLVEHRYKPSVGGAAQTSLGQDYLSAAGKRDYEERYCVDEAFIRAARRLLGRDASSSDVVVTESWIEYVLTTGANWAGSIREFTLTVDKGAPGNLVSFCMDGVRKISPTRFQVTREYFWPERDLEILILEPHRLR